MYGICHGIWISGGSIFTNLKLWFQEEATSNSPEATSNSPECWTSHAQQRGCLLPQRQRNTSVFWCPEPNGYYRKTQIFYQESRCWYSWDLPKHWKTCGFHEGQEQVPFIEIEMDYVYPLWTRVWAPRCIDTPFPDRDVWRCAEFLGAICSGFLSIDAVWWQYGRRVIDSFSIRNLQFALLGSHQPLQSHALDICQ